MVELNAEERCSRTRHGSCPQSLQPDRGLKTRHAVAQARTTATIDSPSEMLFRVTNAGAAMCSSELTARSAADRGRPPEGRTLRSNTGCPLRLALPHSISCRNCDPHSRCQGTHRFHHRSSTLANLDRILCRRPTPRRTTQSSTLTPRSSAVLSAWIDLHKNVHSSPPDSRAWQRNHRQDTPPLLKSQ